MIDVVGIKFLGGSRIYYFSPNKLTINKNDFVIVETERGLQFGQAVTGIEQMKKDQLFLPLKPIIRIALKDDIKTNEKNIKDSKSALQYALNLVLKEQIDMKIYDAEYTFDRNKLIFKFIADDRVDFRELAKMLASKYKTRIELRQIGVRDKAKEISGLGPCGRPLCCSTFLNNFDSVSINMAKNQGIALNPTKINGSCGRLFCCLSYEDDIYTENKKNLPKIGETITYGGKTGKVVELNVLNKTVKICTDNDEIIMVGDLKGGSNK